RAAKRVPVDACALRHPGDPLAVDAVLDDEQPPAGAYGGADGRLDGDGPGAGEERDPPVRRDARHLSQLRPHATLQLRPLRLAVADVDRDRGALHTFG